MRLRAFRRGLSCGRNSSLRVGVVFGQVWLYVQHRRPMDGVEPANPDRCPFDAEELHRRDAEMVWAKLRARGEDAVVVAGRHTQRIRVFWRGRCEVHVENDDDVTKPPEPLELRLVLGKDLDGAFDALPAFRARPGDLVSHEADWPEGD